MAGEGLRYKNAGYTIDKPLLDTNGIQMFIRATKALPEADKYIFVCRESHLQNAQFEKIIKQNFPSYHIITTNKTTEGQAMTCLLAKDYIPEDAFLTIGASDNDMIYDKSKYDIMVKDESVDGWIWTTTHNRYVLTNPNMYGWVNIDKETGAAINVSCKKTISNMPENDHAILGAFTFKKAKFFFDAVSTMVKDNNRINNEFYADIAAAYAIKQGNNIKVFEVDHYISWVTPGDYEIYNEWLNYFKRANDSLM